MTGTVDRTEDELRARAAKIAALLQEAVDEARQLANGPKPPGWAAMLEDEIPFSLEGEIIFEARDIGDTGRSLPEILDAWRRLVAITDEGLEAAWRRRIS